MSNTRSLLKPFLVKRWRALGGAALSTIIVAVVDLARPFPLALIVDRIFAGVGDGPFELTSADMRLLVLVAGLVLAIALTDAVASYLMDVGLERAGVNIVHDLRVAVYSHLQRLSLSWHEHRHPGDLVTGLTGDVGAVGGLFTNSLGTLISAALTLLGMLIVSIFIDPILALASFAVTPALAWVSVRFRHRVKELARIERKKDGEIASMSTEALSAMRVIKALGAGDHEHRRLTETSEERREAGIQAARVEGRFGGLIDILGAAGTVAVIVLGVLRVSAGALSPGELVVMFSYVKKVYRPLRDITRQANKVSQALVRADRVADVLAADAVLPEPKNPAPAPPRSVGDVELRNVTFSYEENRAALNDVTLHIHAGQRTAIVGPSGAGKSTLAALIARFYDPTSGEVLIDGCDIRERPLAWVRSQIGLVLQDTVLFTGSVSDNIAYTVDATPEAIVEAARAAGAHEFISALPESYDTQLGPRGIGLSGGQRQRIAIARALLRDAPILVLDEPTTGLDAASESHVLRGLDVLMEGRTTILITHSMSLARTADDIVVIENGRVVEEGTPGDLVARGGRYADFCREQGVSLREESRSVPHDPALPHISEVLDPDIMAPVLSSSLGSGVKLEDVRVDRVKYAPGQRFLAHYTGVVDGWRRDATVTLAANINLDKRATKAKNLHLAELTNGRAPSGSPLTYEPNLDALIQWLPLDLSIPALALPPGELRERLAQAGIETGASSEPHIVRYKPRKRAVAVLEGMLLKFYASKDAYHQSVHGLLVASSLEGIRTANLIGVVDDLRLTAQEYLHGASPTSATADVVSDAGALLDRLHHARPENVPTWSIADQLREAGISARFAATVVPELADRAEKIMSRLEATQPLVEPTAFSHGDFHYDQLLRLPEGTAIIDFDHTCYAAPAHDLATFSAHVLKGRPDDAGRALETFDALSEAYGHRPEAHTWFVAAAIARRSAMPFRRQVDGWPDKIERMFDAAEACLRS